MKIKLHVYVLTDCRGEKSYDVIKDSSDNIYIYGYDDEGRYHQYDSYEGYHAFTWAETYGFKLECFCKEIDIDD